MSSSVLSNYTTISSCRICGNTNLVPLMDLGEHCLSGRFPRSPEEPIAKVPLVPVKCHGDSADPCGLVQLLHTATLSEMYGAGYGYHSSLNTSMVRHLQAKALRLEKMVKLKRGDLVVDIGSNDATLLKSYQCQGLDLLGVDPTGEYFRSYYPEHIQLIADFFSLENVRQQVGERQAKVITSCAMFYDLERPFNFMRQVHDLLADNGVWLFEQSYLPLMLERNSYDTICHEHLEYYTLSVVQWMVERVGLKMIDIEMNDINGGSFSVIATKKDQKSWPECSARINQLLQEEKKMGLTTLVPYQKFALRAQKHRDEITNFLREIKMAGKKVLGYGASTKGNILLQYCHLTPRELPLIAEINPDKFGCYTPGTKIPIVSEAQARELKPDFFFVLPWHFRAGIIQHEQDFLQRGGHLVFPLPQLEIV